MHTNKRQEGYRVIYTEGRKAEHQSYSGEYENRKSFFIANITKAGGEE